MYKPTTGDLRLIDESVRPWQMTIYPVLEKMEELPAEVNETIKNLSEQYKKELEDYYCKAMDKDKGSLADPIFREFDEKWDKEHPEFYDVDRLFEKAGAADKKRAAEELKAAKDFFTQVSLNSI
ncbi:MAG: hypothetical protein K6G24_03145 [Lachnospiraceae bacterium]|nr:hypothetical protein [Lachnospiraceae bacterium]